MSSPFRAQVLEASPVTLISLSSSSVGRVAIGRAQFDRAASGHIHVQVE